MTTQRLTSVLNAWVMYKHAIQMCDSKSASMDWHVRAWNGGLAVPCPASIATPCKSYIMHNVHRKRTHPPWHQQHTCAHSNRLTCGCTRLALLLPCTWLYVQQATEQLWLQAAAAEALVGKQIRQAYRQCLLDIQKHSRVPLPTQGWSVHKQLSSMQRLATALYSPRVADCTH
jgi:hypothetical protein